MPIFAGSNQKKIMKKLLLIFALVFPICICAQQKLTRKQKRYIRTAKELDILQYLPDTTDYDPSTFWNSVTINNRPLQEELAKFQNPRDLALQAYEEVENKKAHMFFMNRSYNPNTEGDNNAFLRHELLGVGCVDDNIFFRIYRADEMNAFCTPDGYIYINSGLLENKDLKYDMLVGILAHEVTHYMFRHMLIHEHMVLKRMRANNIVAAIALIGSATANAVAASKGGSMDSATVARNYQGIIDGAKEWTKAYHYRYGRENELTSDIVAYRFLEYIGRNPEDYIKALELLKMYTIDDMTDRYDDHPCFEDRIGVLRALEPAYRPNSYDNYVFVCPESQDTLYHIYRDCDKLQSCHETVQIMPVDDVSEEGRNLCEYCKNRKVIE